MAMMPFTSSFAVFSVPQYVVGSSDSKLAQVVFQPPLVVQSVIPAVVTTVVDTVEFDVQPVTGCTVSPCKW